jgi:hypothetical protein
MWSAPLEGPPMRRVTAGRQPIGDGWKISCNTTRAAGSAAIDGQARALDLSAAMPRQAARRAQEEGLANVCFEHDDAQVYRFTPGAGDLALSRMGVMLLAGPAARGVCAEAGGHERSS